MPWWSLRSIPELTHLHIKKKTDYHDTKNVEVQWISSREHGLTLKFHKMEGIFV